MSKPCQLPGVTEPAEALSTGVSMVLLLLVWIELERLYGTYPHDPLERRYR